MQCNVPQAYPAYRSVPILRFLDLWALGSLRALFLGTAYFQGVPYTIGYCTIPAQRPGSRIWRVPDVVSAETECTEVHNTPSFVSPDEN